MIGRQRAILRGQRSAVLVATIARRGAGRAGRGARAALNRRSTSSGVKAIVRNRRRRWSPAPAWRRRGSACRRSRRHNARGGPLVGGKRVEREQRRNDAHRLRSRRARSAILSSRSSLFGVEAVARLDLDRRAAAAHQRVEPRPRLARATPRPTPRRSLRPSRRCRRRPGRSPHRSRRRGASHARRRGCRRRRDACGSRSGPASPRRRRAHRPSWRETRPARCACRRGRSCRRRCRSRHFRSARADCPAVSSMRGDVAVDEQPVPHDLRLRRARVATVKAMSGWPNLCRADFERRCAMRRSALVGAPLAAGSVTPGRCDLAPELLRETLRRIGRYDVETGRELDHAGRRSRRRRARRADASRRRRRPIRDAVAAQRRGACADAAGRRQQCGDPAGRARRSALPLEKVGLITLDAHFDMRDLDEGLSNGNPVRALIEDGLPGRTSRRSASRASPTAAKMHEDAVAAGNLVVTIGEVRARRHRRGDRPRARPCRALRRALVVDCDIDVIDRAQFPGAPGARPGGMAVARFLRGGAAARGRPAGAGDRPDRMGPAARSDRPQRPDRGALGRRVPRRLRAALAHPNSSLSSDGRSSGASCSNVHCFGSLSGRQRSKAGAVAEAAAGDLVVAHFDHQHRA